MKILTPAEVVPNGWVYRCQYCGQFDHPAKPLSLDELLRIIPPYHDCLEARRAELSDLPQASNDQGISAA